MSQFTHSRHPARLAQALEHSQPPEVPVRAADAYPADNDWAASAFLLELLLHAKPLRLPLNRERVRQILDADNCPAKVEQLEARGLIRFVLGRLQIPTATLRTLRHNEQCALSDNERAALQRLEEAQRDKTAPFWVDMAEVVRILEAHAGAHRRTPSLAELSILHVLSPALRGGVEGYALPLNHRGNRCLWTTYLGSRVLGLYWEDLVREQPRTADDELFSRWLDVAIEMSWWASTPEHVGTGARERLLSAAEHRLLVEEDIIDEQEALGRMHQGHGDPGSREGLDTPSPPACSDSLLALFERWSAEQVEDLSRGDLYALVALILSYDRNPWANHAVKLLESSRKRPNLLHPLSTALLGGGRRAIAGLVAHLETASLGMQLLTKLDVSGRWEWDDFLSKESDKDAQKTSIWRGAAGVLLATLHEAVIEHRVGAAMALAETLVLAAQATIQRSHRPNVDQIRNDGAEDRFAILLAELTRSEKYVLIPLASDLCKILSDRATQRTRRQSIEPIPIAEMKILFWLLRVMASVRDAVPVQPMEVAEAILLIYSAALRRATTSDGTTTIFWPDDAREVIALPWLELAVFLQERGCAERLIGPEDIDFGTALSNVPTVDGASGLPGGRPTIHEHYHVWIRKARIHVRILMALHEKVRERVIDPRLYLTESQKNGLLCLVEERLRAIVQSCAAGDHRSGRPSLFQPDESATVDGMPRTAGIVVPLVRTINHFSEANRDVAFAGWIEVEPNPAVLLTIIDEALSARTRGQATAKLGAVDMDRFLGDQLWVAGIERVAHAAAIAGRSDIAEKVLEYGDRVVNPGYRQKWVLFAYRIRLMVAYRRGDIEALRLVPVPIGAQALRIHVDNYVLDPIRDSQSFYRALLLIDTQPEEARFIFDDLLRRNPGIASYAQNRLAASLNIARKLEDPDERRRAFLHALQEWQEVAPSIPASALVEIEDNIVYSRLACLDGAGLDDDFDAEWSRLSDAQRVQIDFVALVVENARRRGLSERIANVLEGARSVHLDKDGNVDERFARLQGDINDVRPMQSPLASVVARPGNDVDALRMGYLGLRNADADIAARVVDAGELHECLANFLIEAAKEFLDRFALFAPFKNEDKYNDVIVSFLRLRLRFLSWYVSDQTRGGESETRKGPGERDWTVGDGRGIQAIFEALCLKCLDVDYVDRHVDKVVSNYNAIAVGCVYVVVYYEGSSWPQFWDKYSSHVESRPPPGVEFVERGDGVSSRVRSANLRMIRLVYKRDRTPLHVYHLAINLGDSGHRLSSSAGS